MCDTCRTIYLHKIWVPSNEHDRCSESRHLLLFVMFWRVSASHKSFGVVCLAINCTLFMGNMGGIRKWAQAVDETPCLCVVRTFISVLHYSSHHHTSQVAEMCLGTRRTYSVFRKGNIVNYQNNATTIKRHDIEKKASPLLLSGQSRSLSERKIFV